MQGTGPYSGFFSYEIPVVLGPVNEKPSFCHLLAMATLSSNKCPHVRRFISVCFLWPIDLVVCPWANTQLLNCYSVVLSLDILQGKYSHLVCFSFLGPFLFHINFRMFVNFNNHLNYCFVLFFTKRIFIYLFIYLFIFGCIGSLLLRTGFL